MLTRTIITVALAGFALTGTAKADTYSHIDSLAVRLQSYALLLDREFTAHYSHTHEYRHLKSDSVKMARLAEHIHEVAHHHGSISHLQSDLRQLDRLFHHVEELVEEIEHDVAFGDIHGDFHGGHIHGETTHVRRILRAMENTLHHLQSDVDELAHFIDDHQDHDH
jgi:hypothetical protein